jgi:hypothetical protein
MKCTEIKDLNFEEFKFFIKNSGIYLDINFNLDFLSNYLGIQTYKTSRSGLAP